jgi:hypothetical protein
MRRTGFLVVVLFGMAGCVALANWAMVTRQEVRERRAHRLSSTLIPLRSVAFSG